jgi:hypothetical protein
MSGFELMILESDIWGVLLLQQMWDAGLCFKMDPRADRFYARARYQCKLEEYHSGTERKNGFMNKCARKGSQQS